MNIQSLGFSVNGFTAAGVVLTTILTTLPTPVQAITLVTQRTALNGNDSVEWSSLGKVFPAAVLPSSFDATSEVGLGLKVQIPPPTPGITPPLVFQTLPPPHGIPTNFAPGDFILFTGLNPAIFPSPGNPGSLTITFDTPVKGAGTQIAVDDTFSFTAFVTAFDANDTLLGSFSVPGTSSIELDNSAAFLGILSDKPNIKRVVYSTSESDRAFAINTLSLNTVPVPEPSSLAALALLGLGALTRACWVSFLNPTYKDDK
ncbi:PEP-CTERM sorting domain-containing protein [Coleofasciculus chthonoplastes]|uniref:PEP-CTERM sorting domain-containing protein n=1 Tax=Coleofasciculus chthonoplastes TaxID=64178 RepID=UPI0005C69228|nr:PEP-CTERM sorting domain-containing protein [Coleofasciculus chthonoplastes]